MNLKSKKVIIAGAVAGALVITPAAMAIQSTIASPGNHSNSNGGGARGGYSNSNSGSRRVADQDHATSGNNSSRGTYESGGDGGRWVWVPSEGSR